MNAIVLIKKESKMQMLAPTTAVNHMVNIQLGMAIVIPTNSNGRLSQAVR